MRTEAPFGVLLLIAGGIGLWALVHHRQQYLLYALVGPPATAPPQGIATGHTSGYTPGNVTSLPSFATEAANELYRIASGQAMRLTTNAAT